MTRGIGIVTDSDSCRLSIPGSSSGPDVLGTGMLNTKGIGSEHD